MSMELREINKMINLSEEEKEITLLELLDRLLDTGIVIHGDIMISIADIDLIYLGLRLVIGSVDTIRGDKKVQKNK